ncbi:hypothetical protein FPV67DRAFT_931396 [Lyophyllum atratum]|nr:hypothetical protein FPV67DRAFT_931396 [Lyophyllum atratum]
MAPTFEFPVPVLSVAAEAVRELEGGEALSGLWTLFTKCKASLKDGHRLENISWRLWYREMAAVALKCEEDEAALDDSQLFNEKISENHCLGDEGGPPLSAQEILPSRTTGHSPPAPSRISVSSPRPHPHSHPDASTISRPILARRNSYVGKIIVDMLPNPLPPTQYPNPGLSSPATEITSYFSSAIRPSSPTFPVVDANLHPIRCHLPTPAGPEEEFAILPSSTHTSTTPNGIASTPALPFVQVEVSAPSTPPPPQLPRLVVVNPTPGPTPHPTPPATPTLGGRLTLKHDSQPPHGVFSDTLMPVPRLPLPPLFVRADGSTTSSSSSGSSGSGRTVASSPSTTVSAGETELKGEVAVPTAAATTVALGPSTKTESGSPTSVRRTSSSGTAGHLPPPGTAGALQAGPSRPRPRAGGHIRQTSSASSNGGRGAGRSTEVAKGTRKSTSTSRSRSRGPDAGLAMTVVGTKNGAGGGKGRTLGPLRRTGSGRGVAGRNGREKRPTFNIGSHSDEGSALGSKSAGSGSSVSGPKIEAVAIVKAGPVQPAPAPPRRAQSSARLPPPPSAQHLSDVAKVVPPQPPRRTIVLATSDSDDYETETDSECESDDGRVQEDAEGEEEEGDAGDWSSEELSTDDVEVVVRRGTAQQQAPAPAPAPAPPLSNTHSGRRNPAQSRPDRAHAPPMQQTQSGQHHAPAPQHLSRVQQSRRNHAAHAQYVVEQAAIETQRIREMFAKKPVPSSEQLAGKRTRSVGLLTQLMNPDPQIFPLSHPYRRGYSSGEINGVAAGLTMTAPVAQGNVGRRGVEHVKGRGVGQGQAQGLGQGQVLGKGQERRASAGMAPGLKQSKSSAAIPVASQVQVGSVAREPSTGAGPAAMVAGSGASGGYRPKGRPADQEMEDDSDSDGEENGRDAILFSKSVAQEKLEALAKRTRIVAHDKKDAAPEEAEPVPDWLREPEPRGNANGRRATHPPPNGASSSRHPQQRQQGHRSSPTPTPAPPPPPPAPIPVGHPYNLPPPAPPSTPRTTRRLMLQTEMSESLRRNLLWERQVSNVNLAAIRRTASGGGGAGRGGTVLGGGLRPLTTLPSMVQVTARQQGAGGNVNGFSRPEERERDRRGSGGAVPTEGPQETEERRKRTMARNRSWANDYHYSGW